jgi:hypothetical protein
MEQIENDFIKLWLEGGIIYGRYKDNVIVDLAAAKKIAGDRITLSNGKDYPSISYIDGLNSIKKEARDFFSHDDGIKHMTKLALITTSPISRIAGNFFLSVSKPTVPTRMFSEKEDAVKWVKER